MEIRILKLLEGARAAEGLTVVIDVFRAFSLECYLMAAGAAAILPVGNKELAYQLKAAHPDWLLAGERNGEQLPGFDFGNSPAQVEGLDLTGRTIIHTTSAGTQGIANACHADEILTGSLVNARAIASYIQQKQPAVVSLVCMGLAAKAEADEDNLCADYIQALLNRQKPDIMPQLAQLRRTTGARFFDPHFQHACPERDFVLCTQPDRFPFILRVEKTPDGLDIIHKSEVPIQL